MRVLVWIGGILVVLVVGFFLYFKFVLQPNTKKHSPEQTVELRQDDLAIDVFYNRPSVKGRTIFGELVPYGEVWRTGANEATTFTSNKSVIVGGEELPAGKYTIWTIPNQDSWTVIFNKKMYGWGVSWGGKASRKEKFDVLKVKVLREETKNSTELFTISFEEGDTIKMNLSWENTKVAVPITARQL